MGRYTYTFYDIPSKTKLGALPLYGVSASDVLVKPGGGALAGTFTGSIRMDSDFTTVTEILDMTRPEATSIWMDRDGTPIWGGILWTRTYQSDGRVIQLNAQSWASYLAKVVWWPTRGSLAGVAQHDLTDNPHNITRFLWQYLIEFASAEYDIGVTLEGYHQLPTPMTTQSFLLAEHKSLDEYARDALTLGSEFRIRHFFDSNGDRVAQFESGPENSLGVTAEAADFGESYEYPGELSKYWLTNSSANAPTRLFGIGKVSGADDIFTVQQGGITNRIGVDATKSYETSDQPTLETMAATDLRLMQNDLNRPVYDVGASESIDLNWNVGDHRRVVIDDPYRFTAPVSGVVRLTGWQLSPADSGNAEQLSITISDPTVLEPLNV
jgi:hypothetical protein